MSAWNFANTKEIEADQELRKDDPNKPIEPSMFANLPGATRDGVFRGGAKIYKAVGLAAATPVIGFDALFGTDYQSEYFKEVIDDTANNAIQFWTSDTATTGAGSQIVGGLGEMVLPMLLGGGNPLPLAVNQGVNTSASLVEQGVDSNTATVVGGAEGAFLYAGGKAPGAIGKNLTQRVVSGAGINTAFGVGMEQTSQGVLNAGGYTEQAKQFEGSVESRSADALMGIAFGGIAHLGAKHARPKITITEESALMTQKNVESYQDKSNSVTPDSAVDISNHVSNMDISVEAMARGERIPVELLKPVKGTPRPFGYQTPNQPALFDYKMTTAFGKQSGVNAGVLKKGAASQIADYVNSNSKIRVSVEEALVISSIETGNSFAPSAKNPDSSAHGVFQVIDSTWQQHQGKSRNSTKEQIRVGVASIAATKKSLSKALGRDLQTHELYMGHMLGAGGAKAVLKADPMAKLINIVRSYDAKNADAIVNNNGMKGLTVKEAIAKWQNKTDEHLAKITNKGVGQSIASGHVPFGVVGVHVAKYNGREYLWGGRSRDGNIDCSGLVFNIWKDNGLDVPYMTTSEMYYRPEKHYNTLARTDVKPGDAIVFRYTGKNGKEVGHTGIVESVDTTTGRVRYYGSQASNGKGKKTGPAYATFEAKNYQNAKIKYLRPKGLEGVDISAPRMLAGAGDSQPVKLTSNNLSDIQARDPWAGVDAAAYANVHRFGFSNDFLTAAVRESIDVDLNNKPFTIDYESIRQTDGIKADIEQIRTDINNRSDSVQQQEITIDEARRIPDVVFTPDEVSHLKLADNTDQVTFYKNVDGVKYEAVAKVDDNQLKVTEFRRYDPNRNIERSTEPRAGGQADGGQTELPMHGVKPVDDSNAPTGKQSVPHATETAAVRSSETRAPDNAKQEAIEGNRAEGGEINPDDSVSMLREFSRENPELNDIDVMVGTDADGQPIKKKLSDALEEIEMEKEQNLKEAGSFTKAAMCAFMKGV